jgi:hypothetical protein
MVTPLDGVLTSASIRRQRGAAFGLALSRTLTPRFGLEFAVDGSATAPTFTPAASSALEASRASFADAFTTFLSPSFVSNQSVTATSTVDAGHREEWLVSGALDITLRRSARSEWHATAGVGLVSDPGTGSAASLTGHYAFLINPGAVPYDETDSVTITSTRTTRPFVLVGGGWSHDLSRRWGVAGDLRVMLSGVGETTSVATNPHVVVQADRSRTLLLFTETSPSLVFSNDPLFKSSLSDSLASFPTFVATGLQIRAELTAGIFLRF